MDLISQPGGDSLVKRAALRKLVPVSDSTLWLWIKKGIFPSPLVLNRQRYWRLTDVQTFIAQRAA